MPSFLNLLTTPCNKNAITIEANSGPRIDPKNTMERKVTAITTSKRIDSSEEI